MKRFYLCLSVILCSVCWSMLSASEVYQENMDSLLHKVTGHRQGIVVLDEGGVKLNVHTSCYFKAPNGVYYYRWWNGEVRFRTPNGIYEPVDDDFCNPKDREPLDYGYRFEDGKMYVYNFKTEKEAVAYDFTLQPGEQFTTPDGVCWEVVNRKTEVFESDFEGQTDYRNEHVVLSVRSSDGKMTDEWVENIGPIRFPIQNWGRTDIISSHTAFFNFGDQKDKLVYFPFAEDPIYGQYVNVEPSPDANEYGARNFMVSAGENSLNVSINCYTWFTRHYCYTYRNDKTFDIHSFELGPKRDGGAGSPSFGLTFPDAPSFDNYNVTYNGETLTTAIGAPQEPSNIKFPYDLNGRRTDKPTKGIYIQNGRKVVK